MVLKGRPTWTAQGLPNTKQLQPHKQQENTNTSSPPSAFNLRPSCVMLQCQTRRGIPHHFSHPLLPKSLSLLYLYRQHVHNISTHRHMCQVKPNQIDSRKQLPGTHVCLKAASRLGSKFQGSTVLVQFLQLTAWISMTRLIWQLSSRNLQPIQIHSAWTTKDSCSAPHLQQPTMSDPSQAREPPTPEHLWNTCRLTQDSQPTFRSKTPRWKGHWMTSQPPQPNSKWNLDCERTRANQQLHASEYHFHLRWSKKLGYPCTTSQPQNNSRSSTPHEQLHHYLPATCVTL